MEFIEVMQGARPNDVIPLTRAFSLSGCHFQRKEWKMVKSCCAVDCKNKFEKGGRLSFYNFPVDKELRSKWVDCCSQKRKLDS